MSNLNRKGHWDLIALVFLTSQNFTLALGDSENTGCLCYIKHECDFMKNYQFV